MLTSSSQQEPYWWHYTQCNCYSITYPWTEQQRAKRLMTKIYAALYFFTREAWIIQDRVFSIWTVTTFKKAICPLRLKQYNLFWRQLWAHFTRKCWLSGSSPQDGRAVAPHGDSRHPTVSNDGQKARGRYIYTMPRPTINVWMMRMHLRG